MSSEPAVASPSPPRITAVTEIDNIAVRVQLLDLDAMPHDRVACTVARRGLSYREYGAWTILREHLWEYGTLPIGVKALARIVGIGTVSLERMVPKLAGHFDRTCEGAWTDDFLMRERGTSLVVPSPEARPINPALSAMRSLNGRAGGRASGRVRREQAEQGRVLLRTEAKSEANGPSKFDETTPAVASDFAGLAPGWLVGSQENLEETNQPTTRASEASLLQTNPVGAALAPDHDVEWIAAMRAVCPGKLEASTAGWGLKAIKKWIAEGCSFELDFLPVLKTFASTNSIVKNAANQIIREGVFRARDTRLADKASAVVQRPDLSKASAETQQLHHSLEATLGPDVYSSWFPTLRLVAKTAGTATLTVRSDFIRKHLEDNFAKQLLAAARSVDAGIRNVIVKTAIKPANQDPPA